MLNDKIKINIANCQYEIIQQLALELGLVLVTDPLDKDSEIFWTDNSITPDQLSQFKPHQQINHFPGIYCISRKDHLGKNLKSMLAAFPGCYDFFPPTWVLPKDFSDFKAQFNEKRAKTFICKPENLSQGKGIFLTRSLEDIPERCVVQRYLYKPYLLDGLKFDLRVYVLLMSCDPLRVYIHKEGLVRLATESYYSPALSNLDNICMHLTNYAINKNSPKFEFSESDKTFSGNKRSLSMLMQRLQENGEDSGKLWTQICDIVIKTLCVAQPLLSHLYRSSQPNDLTNSICFQILGFDIFLDENLKPYLLEVNHTPSFNTDTPLDKEVKTSVIGDALKMLGLKFRTEFEYKPDRISRGVNGLRKARKDLKEKWTKNKLEIEKKYLGGYQMIFPCEGREEYERFMNAAKDVWLTNLGIRKRKQEGLVCIKYSQRRMNMSVCIPGYLREEGRECRALEAKSPQKKLPVIRAFGSFLQPRVFNFTEYCQSFISINKETEKMG